MRMGMRLDESKFKKVHGYEEGKIDTLDKESVAIAMDYKKNVLKNFVTICQNDIISRLRGSDYYVTRKYDGEYAIILYDKGQIVTVNRSGRTRRGIPCIEEAGNLIHAAGIKQGIFPAEIYVEADYKTRVNDLVRTLAHEELIGNLRLAVFDILQINNEPFRTDSYGNTWKEINRVFGKGKLCHPVDMIPAQSGNEVQRIYSQYVDQEKSEGLVVHTPIGLTFKVKPRHNFDVVVIGYAEGSGSETGQVRSMVTAFMPEKGKYQVMTRVAAGLTEKLRLQLFNRFATTRTNNPFEGMTTKYTGMVFVKPELVIEITIGDIVTELVSGERTNFLLDFDGQNYRIEKEVKGAKLYAPVFIRLRPDKSPDEHDTSPAQLNKYIDGKPKNNQLVLKDVFINDQDGEVKHLIYKTPNGEYKYYRTGTDNTHFPRFLSKDKNILSISNQYEKGVRSSLSNGYYRDTDQLMVTEEFMFDLQHSDDDVE